MRPKGRTHAEGPRRLAKATSIALLVQLLATGITGALATGPDTPAGLPEAFQTPEVRPGDSALYSVSTPDGNEAPLVDGHRLASIGLEWQDPGFSLASNGSYPWTTGLVLTLELEPDDADERQETSNARIHTFLDPRTWTATGTTLATETRNEVTLDGQPVGLSTQRGSQWVQDLVEPTTPCGFHLPFHGTPANLSQPLQSGDCGGPDESLNATAVEEVDGIQTLRLTTTEDSLVDVWYAPTSPLPVQWTGPLSALGYPSQEPVHLQMDSQERGERPLAVSPDEEAPPDWHVPLNDWQDWGPTERNLENVSLPLSEAYQVLLNRSQDARTFLEENPEAYTALAEMHRDRDELERPRTTWQLVLTDGQDELERFVSRSAPVSEDATRLEVQPPAHVWTREDAPVEPATTPDHYPHPDHRPPSLPVVDGHVLAINNQAGYAPWESPRQAYYGFQVRCLDAACEETNGIVQVGAKPATYEDPTATALPWAEETSTRVAGLGSDGEIRYLTGATSNSTVAAFESGDANAPPTGPGGELEAAWTTPSVETATGISILALLTGALYYFWPKLKLFAVGLYSRIGRDPDDVLGNQTRRRIFDLVLEEPGIHFRELRRETGAGGGMLEHHLEKLVRADLLQEHHTDGYRCYFVAGHVDQDIVRVANAFRTDAARSIARALASWPGASLSEIAETADVTRGTASYHVDALVEHGLVDKEREGRCLQLHLTTLGQRAIESLVL